MQKPNKYWLQGVCSFVMLPDLVVMRSLNHDWRTAMLSGPHSTLAIPVVKSDVANRFRSRLSHELGKWTDRRMQSVRCLEYSQLDSIGLHRLPNVSSVLVRDANDNSIDQMLNWRDNLVRAHITANLRISTFANSGASKLGQLPRLTSLSLFAAQVKDISWLASLPLLRRLTLNCPKVKSGLQHLRHTTELEQLNLEECEIDSSDYRHISHLSLTELVVGVQFDNHAMAHLMKPPLSHSLRTLSLGHSEVDRNCVLPINFLNNLTSLHLMGVDVGPDISLSLLPTLPLRHLHKYKGDPEEAQNVLKQWPGIDFFTVSHDDSGDDEDKSS